MVSEKFTGSPTSLTSDYISSHWTSMALQCSSASQATIREKHGHSSALEMGPRKKPFVRCHSVAHSWLYCRTMQDPLVHHGRHFGWAIHAFCNVQMLITNGIVLMSEDIDINDESLMAMWAFIGCNGWDYLLMCKMNRERKEFAIFKELLHMIPSMEACLMESSEEMVTSIAELVSGWTSLTKWFLTMLSRYRRASMVLGLTIQKEWKSPSLIGLLWKARAWIFISPRMWSQGGALIMSAPGHSCALLVSTGPISSKPLPLVALLQLIVLG